MEYSGNGKTSTVKGKTSLSWTYSPGPHHSSTPTLQYSNTPVFLF